MGNNEKVVTRHNLALPRFFITVKAANLPFYTDLLAICVLGYPKIRGFAGNLSGNTPNFAVPSISSGGI